MASNFNTDSESEDFEFEGHFMQLSEIGDCIRSCDSESDVELSSDDEAETVDHDAQLD